MDAVDRHAALESRHLGRLVAQAGAPDLVIGLLTNCSDLLGMLAGLQRPATPAPAGAVGLAGPKHWPGRLAWSLQTDDV